MSLKDFIKDRAGAITLNFIGLITLIIFLFSVGNSFNTLGAIFLTWISISYIFYGAEYYRRKKYFQLVFKAVDNLDKKYLISEVIEEPPYKDAVPYFELMKKARKSMLEEINSIRNQRKEYKEYIEQWIHEVKTPIASIKLLEENNKSPISRSVLLELQDIDRYVEQALFYARSEEVEKDYLIKEITLQDCVNEVIIRNKHMLISNGIDVDLNSLDKNVYCDSKWLEFIINQIVVNAIKYRKNVSSQIKIYGQDIKNGAQLIIEDNGIGIKSEEISRVFEKGFTGTIGRFNNKSTGIGLYLCKKLCDKLGLLIDIESEEGKLTRVIITFPKGTFSKV
ncbi:MAG: sensor histidine kinase [Clostridium sp.]|nr:sensor histidine kinase [Clostridium sp.]MDU7082154.1 sensor histidine kinase [Clostridium sp.]